jgi:hypothetical protein
MRNEQVYVDAPYFNKKVIQKGRFEAKPFIPVMDA